MNEKNFEDGSEQFLSGDFSNEIGDDFFGFKELGLDKEFKMIGNSIPLQLLQSKLSEANQIDDIKKTPRQEFELKPFKRLSDEDIPKQIILFQPFLQNELYRTKQLHSKQFKSKKEAAEYMATVKGVTIFDDEDYPKKQQRPKLPPTGKITASKRKIFPNTFFLPDDSSVFENGV
jgi:transcriptional activator SPT7